MNAKEMFETYLKLAEQGNASAQLNLACCYMNGDGVENNQVEAVKWCRKAAEQGLAEAQFNMGISYSNGYGVEQNDIEAVKWLRKAAEQGDKKAEEEAVNLEKRISLEGLSKAIEKADSSAFVPRIQNNDQN